MEFKDRLLQLRKELGLTQEEFAEKIGYSRTAISAWEIGRNEPSNSDVIKIANFFNVSTDYLLGKTEVRNAEEANFQFAFHKDDIDTEGLTKDDIKEALEIYRMLKARENKEKKDGK